jgi:hypothetical protein
MPLLVSLCSNRAWSEDFMQSALSAIAASKGQTSIAEALLELSPSVSSEFMEWFYSK